MRLPLSLLLALVVAQPAAAADAPSRVALTGDILSRHFPSPSLGRALAYSVYLPPDYAASDWVRYPTVYLLHGVLGNEHSWLRAGKAAETAARLIAAGLIRPVILVMPDGGRSWYVDSPPATAPDAAGPVETALVRDLIGHIDGWLSTQADRSGRAIAGLSMGGFGALRLAFCHPHLFAATAALSPAIFPTLQSGETLDQRQVRLFHGAFGRPFDPGRFNMLNPFSLVPRLAETPAPPAIYLSVGDDDYFGLEDGTMRLYLALKEAAVPAEIRVRDGGHSWELWSGELPEVLRFFDRVFGGEPS